MHRLLVLLVLVPAASATAKTPRPDAVDRVPARVVHELVLRAEGREERFTVETPNRLTVSPRSMVVGRSIDPVAGRYPCEGRRRGPQHADETTSIHRTALRIPNGSRAELSQTVRLRRPPRPGEGLGTTFRLVPDFPGAEPSIRRTQVFRSPGPRYTGPIGTRLTVTVGDHRAEGPQRRTSERVTAGLPILISGRSRPRARRVEIRVVAPGNRRSQRLVTLATTRSGRFSYLWVPQRAGHHEVFALVRARRKRARDMSECSVVVPVRRPSGATDPASGGPAA